MTASETGADGSGYFVYHSIGMYPGKAEAMAKALAEFADGWGAFDDGQWMRALGLRQQFIDRWRAIIDAPPGTLTTTENVTTALYSLIGSLPERHLKGRRVLVAADCFPSMHFLLSGLAGRYGFTLDTVPIRPGETWVRDEDMIAHWGAEVGLALVTFVTSTSSHRADLERLVAHGRRMGSLVGVDITQAVGLLAFSVMKPAVDFTISTTLKWLCGTPGAGILHVAEPLIAECRPELRGWFSQENIFSWDIDAFAYAADARRFDHGTPAILPAVGSLPALERHAGQDFAARLAHNRALSALIIAEADGLGLPLVSPRDETERGGSVMLRLPSGADPQGVVRQLLGRGVQCDTRGNTLRLSPGEVTTEAGVARLVEGLHRVVKAAA
jgi:selenocysteine lyase/cysteine desulfurase